MAKIAFPTPDQIARLTAPAWEFQAWDTPRGFGYFTEYYLALPKERRSLAEAYRRYLAQNGKKVVGKIHDVPRQWRYFADGTNSAEKRPPGSPFEHSLTWAQRALLRDLYLEKQVQEQLKQEILEFRRKEIDLGKKLLERANTMLSTPLHRREVSDGGKLIVVEPTDWQESDIARSAEVGSKLARRGFELDTEKIAISDWREKLLQSGIDPQQFLTRIVAAMAAADTAGSGSDRQ